MIEATNCQYAKPQPVERVNKSAENRAKIELPQAVKLSLLSHNTQKKCRSIPQCNRVTV